MNNFYCRFQCECVCVCVFTTVNGFASVSQPAAKHYSLHNHMPIVAECVVLVLVLLLNAFV